MYRLAATTHAVYVNTESGFKTLSAYVQDQRRAVTLMTDSLRKIDVSHER